jgi:hypothetical protein
MNIHDISGKLEKAQPPPVMQFKVQSQAHSGIHGKLRFHILKGKDGGEKLEINSELRGYY